MEKQIKHISKKEFVKNADGFDSIDLFNSEYDFEPFLVFTEFYMNRLIFGPHPHAGISVMTYMLPDSEGSFINRDSRGDRSIIEPGALHVTQAGRGVKHVEYPLNEGTSCHGFQIWINHADRDRLVEPKALHAAAHEIPEWNSDKVKLRVVLGSYQNVSSPVKLVTEVLLFDIALKSFAEITLTARPTAFIYNITGEIVVGDQRISGSTLITFKEMGDEVRVATEHSKANFIFADGTPHHEPIVSGGPFVMTTEKQMAETYERLRRGEMGELI